MSTEGFHSEWITIREHRILLECRDSFPGDEIRFIAKVAAITCERNVGNGTRVLRVFYNDKACFYSIELGTCDNEQADISRTLENIIQSIFCFGNCGVETKVYPVGNIHSDRYDHMQYLSQQAGII